jgi:hypothetical protein
MGQQGVKNLFENGVTVEYDVRNNSSTSGAGQNAYLRPYQTVFEPEPDDECQLD